jgi:hypothetical protein
MERFYPNMPLPKRRFLPGQGMEHPSKNWVAHFGDATLLLHNTVIDATGQSTAFRYGADCYNEGFYWEAHELWESLWQSVKRKDETLAAALKALIQFAAANVQLLCQKPNSWDRIAARAIRTATEAGVHESNFLGINWPAFLSEWREVRAGALPQPVPIVFLA